MTILIIGVALAITYIFAAVTFYYGFKNWHPMCGGTKSPAMKGIRLRFPGKKVLQKNC
jgi:hypothetical protein